MLPAWIQVLVPIASACCLRLWLCTRLLACASGDSSLLVSAAVSLWRAESWISIASRLYDMLAPPRWCLWPLPATIAATLTSMKRPSHGVRIRMLRGGAWMILRMWSPRSRLLLLSPKLQDGSFAMRRTAKARMLSRTLDTCCIGSHRLPDDAWAVLWVRHPWLRLRHLPL